MVLIAFVASILLIRFNVAVISVETYDGVDQITDLTAGDYVVIRSFRGCCLNANVPSGSNDGTVECKGAFQEESQLWEVVQPDPTNEPDTYRFKNIGASSETGSDIYLKVSNKGLSSADSSDNDVPFVGTIHGGGVSTEFTHHGGSAAEGEFDYERKYSEIQSIRVSGKCIRVDANFNVIAVETCSNPVSRGALFTFEIQKHG